MLVNPYPELTEKCKEFRKILYNPNTSDDEFFNTVDKFYEVTQKLLNYFNMKLKELEDKCNNAETEEQYLEMYKQYLEMREGETFMEVATGLDPEYYGEAANSLRMFASCNDDSRVSATYNCIKSIYSRVNSEEDIEILANIMNGIKAMLTISYHYRRLVLDLLSLTVSSKWAFRDKWKIFREMGSCDDFIEHMLTESE